MATAFTFLTGFFGSYYSSDSSEPTGLTVFLATGFTAFLGLTSSSDSSSELDTFLLTTFLTSLEGFLAFGFGYSDSSSEDDSAFLIAFFATSFDFLASFLEGATIGTLSSYSLEDSTGFLTIGFFTAVFLGASSDEDSSSDEGFITAFLAWTFGLGLTAGFTAAFLTGT